MARTASRRRLPRDVIANIYLHARLRCGVGRLEQLCRRRPIEILLATVLAAREHPPDNDDGSTALQRHGRLLGLDLALSADDTHHGFFRLVNPSPQPAVTADEGSPTTVAVRTVPCYRVAMRLASARVVKGSIVTRARFPEGTRLTLVPHDDGPPVSLDPDEEAGVLKGIAEIAAGRGIPVRTVRRKLRGRP